MSKVSSSFKAVNGYLKEEFVLLEHAKPIAIARADVMPGASVRFVFPAFFAAGKYGIGLIVVMGVVFAISTIATYMLLCVYSTAGLQRVRLGVLERYGEVLSGVFIALVGVAFWIWPVI
jgi:hypothetical protein